MEKIKSSSIFAIFMFKGYLVKRLSKDLLSVAIPSIILCALHQFTTIDINVSFSLPGLMGAALGVLLVFRTNTAYDRWWEARKVWGALVNTSRSFAQFTGTLPLEAESKDRLFKLIQAFPYALKEHLRSGLIYEEVSFLAKEDYEELKDWKHHPNAIANMMLRHIKQNYNRQIITDYQFVKFNDYTDLLTDILGKCERIKKTPIPIAHAFLLKIYVWIYALIMPIGFIETLGWWTVFAVAIIYYVAMSLVTIAEEIEEPFGHDPNDLPLDGMSQTIQENVKEIQKLSVTQEPTSVSL